jgi:hypothetical protein
VIETIGHVFLYFKNVLETNAMLIKKAGKLKKKKGTLRSLATQLVLG